MSDNMVKAPFPKLSTLISYLNSLRERVDLKTLGVHLASLDVTVEDIKDACVFGDTGYRRNKIGGSDWYDLLVICWKPGQASAIHDHVGSSCGFRIVTGVATEVRYVPAGSGPENTLLVKPASTSSYHRGDLCLAEDKAIHRISNESRTHNLVTLHIYSPPLHMNYYTLAPGLDDHIIAHEPEVQRLLAGERLPGERSLVDH